jgi:hypothetical protein
MDHPTLGFGFRALYSGSGYYKGFWLIFVALLPSPTGGLFTSRVDHPTLGFPLRSHQQQVLGNMLRVRALVAQSRERLQQERTNEFLSAAASGDPVKIQLVSEPRVLTWVLGF